jgi:hypothetical protein
MERTTPLYYESHITISPVFGTDREQAEKIGEVYGFRMAKLVMRKAANDPGSNHTDDSFMTGHSINLADIEERTAKTALSLRAAGFVIRRYKIEETMCDSRHADILRLLS